MKTQILTAGLVSSYAVSSLPVKVFGFTGFGSGIQDLFLQFFDSKTALTTGAIPLQSFLIQKLNGFSYQFPSGLDFKSLNVIVSTTEATLTTTTNKIDLQFIVESWDSSLEGATTVGDLLNIVDIFTAWTGTSKRLLELKAVYDQVGSTGSNAFLIITNDANKIQKILPMSKNLAFTTIVTFNFTPTKTYMLGCKVSWTTKSTYQEGDTFNTADAEALGFIQLSYIA